MGCISHYCRHTELHSKLWSVDSNDTWVLVALMQCPATAAFVSGMYIVIQVESNFIKPMVQQKLINIPPARIIIAQLLTRPLTGWWVLVLATPLMVIKMILMQELYIMERDKKTA